MPERVHDHRRQDERGQHRRAVDDVGRDEVSPKQAHRVRRHRRDLPSVESPRDVVARTSRDPARGAERRPSMAPRTGRRRARRAGSARDLHLPEGTPFDFPDGDWPSGGRPPSVARTRPLGGARPVDAAAPRRVVRGLGVLARAGARVQGLVRQPPGAVPTNHGRLRHPGSRARHLGAARRRVAVEGRRAARRARARRAVHRPPGAEIRAVGRSVAADLDTGRRWWSDDWASWTPDPAW